MKRIGFILIVLISFYSISFASELTDIDNHWAKESILRLVEAKAINGYEDNTFKPDENITIAEFIKILVVYSDYEKILVGEMWPDWYINTAKYYGFIGENEFSNYDEYITRNEASRIVARFINIEDKSKAKSTFKDVTDDTILRLADIGVINGYEDDTFRGENNMTRAESTVIICKAMVARRNTVANKKYNIYQAEKLTNIGREASYKSYYRNRYEIKNNKILFYDDGRYANLDGAQISEKIVENKILIKLIESLIQEDAYVAVNYVPNELTCDQIVVDYGEREGYVYNKIYNFCFIFYPNQQFNLKESSQNDSLSDNCFMKIIIARMWKDSYDMIKGEYSHELNNQKLLKALKAVFDCKDANEIYEYIQKWRPILFEQGSGKRFVEVKLIGNYEVNLYTTGNTRVELYISKRH